MINRKYVFFILALFMFAGCTATMSPIAGSLFTDVRGPVDVEPSSAQGTVVEGRAMATGIFGFVTGDCSYEAAIEDALSNAPGATRLENVVVDHHTKNVLMIYAEFTTIVKGVAVK
jgi:hypothetical protein